MFLSKKFHYIFFNKFKVLVKDCKNKIDNPCDSCNHCKLDDNGEIEFEEVKIIEIEELTTQETTEISINEKKDNE